MRLPALAAAGLLVVGACAITPVTYQRDGAEYGVVSGAFRGRWYNHYERGLSFLAGGYYDEAVTDLRRAIELRPRDQRRARTYGLHFIDYFPHRELGIAYLAQKRLDEAMVELQTSLGQVDSGRAEFYFDAVRRERLAAGGVVDTLGPAIVLDVADGHVTAQPRFVVRGRIRDAHSLVAGVSVAGKPVLLPTAVADYVLAQEVTLTEGTNELVLTATDLFGNAVERRVGVLLDRTAPTFTVDEVRETPSGLEVRGHVTDDTGLASAQLDGKPARTSPGATTEALTFTTRGKTAVKLEDVAGNVTLLELDPKAVLDELSRADTGGPRIEVRAPPATVYDDSVFIDGSVSDPSGIKSLSIQGALTPGGGKRTLYFRKVVSLSPGENRIVFTAEDARGMSAEHYVNVRYVPPPHRALEARLSLTLAPLVPVSASAAGVAVVETNLANALVEQQRFHVLDRERAAALATEWQLVATDLATDGPDLLRIAEAMHADASILGWVREDAEAIEVYARIVDAETHQILVEKDVFHEKKSLKNVQELLYGLGLKLKAALPMLAGSVTADGDQLTVSLAGADLLPPGARLLIVAPEDGGVEAVVGEARLVAAQGESATASLVRGVSLEGAKVVTK